MRIRGWDSFGSRSGTFTDTSDAVPQSLSSVSSEGGAADGEGTSKRTRTKIEPVGLSAIQWADVEAVAAQISALELLVPRPSAVCQSPHFWY